MTNSKEPLPIKDVVNKVIADLSNSASKEHRPSAEEIKRLWKQAVGKMASQRSRPVSLKKGKLVVHVEDSSFLYNLTLRKREILKNLAKDLENGIQDIQFRIGETGEEEKTKGKRQKGRGS
ncbi:MAG: DUF721 domain-containing protein [Candidatus Omnitrophica bacterium]|nr:DUF721 domain-containing protein [Candidatus Omnitrophota bacterium]